jgi:Alginate lyase
MRVLAAFETLVAAGLVLIFAGVAPPDPPRLLLLDADYLSAVRARIKGGDDHLKRALAALERDAAKALAMAPVSVMDKGVTPPSGDKHDYMSQAPYWWPDPTKPDGRPYIRRDGERNPEIDRITDHDNFGRVIGSVATLGLAFHLTGDNKYATHARRLVHVWFLDPATRMNPHLRFGQGIPGVNDGRGIGIIETARVPELLDGVLLFSPSPAWTPSDESGLQDWMRAYLRWLVESDFGRDESKNGNNHETWYDVQVASLAFYTGQLDLARRTLEGSKARIARHVEPDGRQPLELERTRPWNYSVYNLTAFFQLATLGERVGVDLWSAGSDDGRSLRRALDFLVPFATRERPWTYKDLDRFEPGALEWLLRRAAVAWKDPRYRSIASAIGGRERLNLTLP